jgi:hypothetical protein
LHLFEETNASIRSCIHTPIPPPVSIMKRMHAHRSLHLLADHKDGIISIGIVGNGKGFDTGREGEFDGGSIDNSDHIAGAGSFNDGIKGSNESIFQIDFHDLFVIVGTLQQFNAGIERSSIGLQQDGHGRHFGIKGIRHHSPTLNGFGRSHLRQRNTIGDQTDRRIETGIDGGHEREFHTVFVAHSDSITTSGCFQDTAEGTFGTIFDIDTDLKVMDRMRGVCG